MRCSPLLDLQPKLTYRQETRFGRVTCFFLPNMRDWRRKGRALKGGGERTQALQVVSAWLFCTFLSLIVKKDVTYKKVKPHQK